MRPNKVIMTGFGPYAEKTEVNFDELGESGLYLITGNTGAGKTTIFDAVSFALFGKASGKNRDKNMFRSKFADCNTPTEVELYFTYNQRQYYVKRNPEYERAKKSGEGTTKQSANAELILSEERVVTGEKNVNKAIIDLIGIDGDQFSQIAMLAQGAFLEMLFANTSDREKIFRNIFKTDKYEQLMKKIKSETMELASSLHEQRRDITTHAKLIQCQEEDVLSVEVNKAMEGELLSSEIITLLDKLIGQDQEREKEFGEKISAMEEKLWEFTKGIAQGIEFQKNKRALEEKESVLSEKLEEKKKLEEEKIKAEQQKIVAEKKRTNAAKIATVLSEYDALDLNRRNLEITLVELQTLQSGKELLKEKMESFTQKLEKLKKERERLQDTRAEIVALQGKNDECRNVLEQIKKRKAEIQDLELARDDLKKLQQQLKISFEACSMASQEYNDKNDLFIAEQAGILAEVLRKEKDRPCPVCGSTNHPNLAEKSENAPTKEEVQRAKERFEQEEKKKNELGTRVAEEKSKVENQEKNLKVQLKEITGKDVELSQARQVLESEQEKYTELQRAVMEMLTEASDKEKRREEIEIVLPNTEADLAKCQEQQKDKEIKLTEASKDRDNLNRLIEGLAEKLEFASKKEAEEMIAKLQREAEEIDEKIASATKALNNAIEAIARLEGEKKTLEASLKKLEEVDVESALRKQEEAKKEKTQLVKNKENMVSRIDTNRKCKNNIEAVEAKIAEVEKRYAIIKALDDTVKGEVKGKSKITLEAYVQTFYFDRIIHHANLRFLDMTDGHYELVRSTEGNGNTKVGLDLSVKDHYSGAIRDVKSLSGGESFEAALSLALGLADEIEACAGGIQLDVMFVDEGFGSLDEEALDKAIKALQKISESKRLVGIISHVAELKNRMDKQIVVTKGNTGESSIQIVT